MLSSHAFLYWFSGNISHALASHRRSYLITSNGKHADVLFYMSIFHLLDIFLGSASISFHFLCLLVLFWFGSIKHARRMRKWLNYSLPLLLLVFFFYFDYCLFWFVFGALSMPLHSENIRIGCSLVYHQRQRQRWRRICFPSLPRCQKHFWFIERCLRSENEKREEKKI